MHDWCNRLSQSTDRIVDVDRKRIGGWQAKRLCWWPLIIVFLEPLSLVRPLPMPITTPLTHTYILHQNNLLHVYTPTTIHIGRPRSHRPPNHASPSSRDGAALPARYARRGQRLSPRPQCPLQQQPPVLLPRSRDHAGRAAPTSGGHEQARGAVTGSAKPMPALSSKTSEANSTSPPHRRRSPCPCLRGPSSASQARPRAPAAPRPRRGRAGRASRRRWRR